MQEANGNASTVVGNAVLVASSTSPPAPETVTILNFTDSENAKVAEQFSGVTSMLKDTSRGLIYLANPEGLWVLPPAPATDTEFENEFGKYILYSH